MNFGKGALRTAKNYTKGYSHTQTKVRNVTSNDPLPPSGRQMHEIAQMTYNQDDFIEIVEMLDKRLNDKGKNWRHVYKCLTLLDYLLHSGSENVIIYFRENIYIIKTLREFQYLDDDGKDQGANVRQRAKDITNLLADDARLRAARRARSQMYQRMARGRPADDDDDDGYDLGERRRSATPVPTRRSQKEEDDLRRALQESKRLTEKARATAEERDIQRALKLSEEEEARRRRAVADATVDANAAALFDPQQQQAVPTGQLIDATLPLQYAVTLQPQYTAVQPQFTSVQPQYTSFNPWQQQAQAQLEAIQQADWMRQQQELQAQQQQQEWLAQQQMLQAQQTSQMMQMPQQPIPAQPTGFGSNNPFAPGPSSSAPPLGRQLTSPGPRQAGPPTANMQSTYSGRENAASAPPTAVRGPTRADQEHAHLAGLVAARAEGDDGVDTFGNVGNLRFGFTPAGRLAAQRTGAPGNPFAQ